MKINLVYFVVPLALASLMYVYKDIQSQSEFSFFGTAETVPCQLSVDVNVWVEKLNVAVGSRVHKGDTVAVLSRRLLDRLDLSTKLSLYENEATLIGQKNILEGERKVLQSEIQSKLNDIDAKIRALQLTDSLERSYRQTVLGKDPGESPKMTVQRKILMEEKVADQKIYSEKFAAIDKRETAFQLTVGARENQQRLLNEHDQQERMRLYIVAPSDGYVDKVNMALNNPVQAFNQLIEITPLHSASVIGFIPEAAIVPVQISDSVDLESVARPGIKSTGVIISSSPSLVEMPLRLRKFIEVRAWGREVKVFMPDTNDFYIGEKLNITIRKNK